MNVYIRELSRQMGRRAHTMDVFTRRVDPKAPQVAVIDERTRVIQIDAGPPGAAKRSIRRYLPQFAQGVLDFQASTGAEYDLVHSHYWLSGSVGQMLKTAWGVPHVVMFHTLAEAKNRHHFNAREPAYRVEGERIVAGEADRIICAGEGEKEMLSTCTAPADGRTASRRGHERSAREPARARRKLGLPDDLPSFVGARAAGGSRPAAPPLFEARTVCWSPVATPRIPSTDDGSGPRWGRERDSDAVPHDELPPTTTLRTSALCPRTTRASVWWLSRRWPAVCRLSRREWGGSRRRCWMGGRGTWCPGAARSRLLSAWSCC
jgi:hypothetical protein